MIISPRHVLYLKESRKPFVLVLVQQTILPNCPEFEDRLHPYSGCRFINLYLSKNSRIYSVFIARTVRWLSISIDFLFGSQIQDVRYSRHWQQQISWDKAHQSLKDASDTSFIQTDRSWFNFGFWASMLDSSCLPETTSLISNCLASQAWPATWGLKFSLFRR